MSKSQYEDSELLLYFNHNSFYSQKVLMTLYEKKLNFKTHLINLSSMEQYESWFLEINPLGQVPVLVDGMKIIPDSKRIIEYLEDNFSNGYKKLLPLDANDKLNVIQLRDFIDDLPIGLITKGASFHAKYLNNPKIPFLSTDRAHRIEIESKRSDIIRQVADSNPQISDILLSKAEQQDTLYENLKSEQSYEEALSKIEAVLNNVEEILSDNSKDNSDQYLFSSDFTMADISLTVLLVRLDNLGLSHRYWNNKQLRIHIHKYYMKIKHRESYKQSIPQYNSDEKADSSLIYIISTISILIVISALYLIRNRK